MGIVATIIFYAFIFWVAVQCGYACYFFVRILWLKDTAKADGIQGLKPVSIIICARNEAENLEKYLPKVLSQKYLTDSADAAFEVIVVNDASTDGTEAVLNRLKENYKQLRTVTISAGDERTLKAKNFALSMGVQSANYDWLMLTDADCYPASENWLSKMVAPLCKGKEIVAGFGAYTATGGLLNAFSRWENVHAFLQMATYYQAGKPYMAVGRNLVCTKSMMKRAIDTPTWDAIASGDDDLLVNLFATPTNYIVVSDPESFTYSGTKQSLGEYIQQKQRHLSVGKLYKPGIQRLLGAYGFTHAATWFYFVMLAFTGYLPLAACILGTRCALYWSLWAVTAIRLKDYKLIALFPLFDFGWMLYNFAFTPYILFKSKKSWK